MTTVIFSDTHLTDKFDPFLLEKLKTIISKADLVIINGDFWDGYLTTFDLFIRSKWKELFPLLKEKNAIYIYGNHDPIFLCDQRVDLFSVSQRKELKVDDQSNCYYIQHGHLITGNFTAKLLSLIPLKLQRFGYILIKNQENKSTKIGQISQYIVKKLEIKGDKKLKKYVSKLENGQRHYFIFGHTHIPFSSDGSSYLNSGRLSKSNLSYVKIDDRGCYLMKVD